MPFAPIHSTASATSCRSEAPVERMMGLPKPHMYSMKGLLVMSEEEILYTSIRGLRKLALSTSKGVDMKAMSSSSHQRLSCSNSFFQKLSCFLKSSYWLKVGSLVVSQ